MVSAHKLQFKYVVAAIVLVLAIAGYRIQGLYTGVMERTYAYGVYPFLRLQEKLTLPLKQLMQERYARAHAYQELQELKEENVQLRAQIIELQAALIYAEQIHELVEFKKQFAYPHGKITRILACCCTENEQYFLIDAGSRHAIHHDMVAVYKNCLIGRVSEVYPLYSKVTLITDKSCKVAATCAKTGICGIHVGNNNTHLTLMQRVSHLHQMQPGDLVLSSGEGLVFPQGYALGVVDSIMVEGLYQIISIRPLIDVTSLTHCTIIQKGESSFVDNCTPISHTDARKEIARTELQQSS